VAFCPVLRHPRKRGWQTRASLVLVVRLVLYYAAVNLPAFFRHLECAAPAPRPPAELSYLSVLLLRSHPETRDFGPGKFSERLEGLMNAWFWAHCRLEPNSPRGRSSGSLFSQKFVFRPKSPTDRGSWFLVLDFLHQGTLSLIKIDNEWTTWDDQG
jgi:hypothetical protein